MWPQKHRSYQVIALSLIQGSEYYGCYDKLAGLKVSLILTSVFYENKLDWDGA